MPVHELCVGEVALGGAGLVCEDERGGKVSPAAGASGCGSEVFVKVLGEIGGDRGGNR